MKIHSCWNISISKRKKKKPWQIQYNSKTIINTSLPQTAECTPNTTLLFETEEIKWNVTY